MDLASARAAADRGDFDAALEALGDGEGQSGPEYYELRALASYGAGAFEDAVAAWERLYAICRDQGDRLTAARAAVMAAMLLLVDSGLLSVVRGWVRRAERLLDGEVDAAGAGATPVHALIAAVRTYERFMSGDMDTADAQARQAIGLGERFDVPAATVIGRTAAGRIAVLRGDVDGGLEQLDEVAAILMSGELDALTTGMMYSELVCAAQGLFRPDRAQEWTDAMQRWGDAEAIGGIHGRCRVHRAELLRMSGPSDDAEREALQACVELRPWMRREFGWPLVELGTVRLRRGDLAGAEEAFLAASDHGWPPHPGLALVRMEQGDLAEAMALIATAIAHPVEAPSKELPPFGDLRLVPLLDAQAEIAEAAGDAATVASAAQVLEEIAERFGGPTLQACAALAGARAALLAGDAREAVGRAQVASAGYAALGATYDVGRARTVLAAAHHLGEDTAAARLELGAARRAYAAYGARRRAEAIDEHLETGTPTARHGAEVRRGRFVADGPTWVVELAGTEARCKDLKGMRYLHRLVAEPGREFHVLDLVAVEDGTLRAAGAGVEGTTWQHGTDGVPVLDDAARDAYRRRLAEIDDDLADAAACNDLGRQAKAEADRQYLVDELTRAVGLGDRIRTTGASSERARTRVARALRYALAEIDARHPAFGEHLRASIRTGTYCSYRPDPYAIVEWQL